MLVNFGDDSLEASLAALNQLRNAGIAAELYPSNAKLKKQFAYADKKGVPFTLMIGSAEMETGRYKLKNMQSGEQEELPMEQILERLR